MAGTIFLYLYWPSFNAALAPAINQQRIVVNTALSMSASCICACSTARLIHGKLDMEIVLNATLAGGVIIGACVDMIVDPFASRPVKTFCFPNILITLHQSFVKLFAKTVTSLAYYLEGSSKTDNTRLN